MKRWWSGDSSLCKKDATLSIYWFGIFDLVVHALKYDQLAKGMYDRKRLHYRSRFGLIPPGGSLVSIVVSQSWFDFILVMCYNIALWGLQVISRRCPTKENFYLTDDINTLIFFLKGKCDWFQLFGFNFVSFTTLLSVSRSYGKSSSKCNCIERHLKVLAGVMNSKWSFRHCRAKHNPLKDCLFLSV